MDPGLALALIMGPGIVVAALLVAAERRLLRDWRRDLRPRLWAGVAVLSLVPAFALAAIGADNGAAIAADPRFAHDPGLAAHERDMASDDAALLVVIYVLFSLPIFLTGLFRYGLWKDRNELTPLES